MFRADSESRNNALNFITKLRMPSILHTHTHKHLCSHFFADIYWQIHPRPHLLRNKHDFLIHLLTTNSEQMVVRNFHRNAWVWRFCELNEAVMNLLKRSRLVRILFPKTVRKHVETL